MSPTDKLNSLVEDIEGDLEYGILGDPTTLIYAELHEDNGCDYCDGEWAENWEERFGSSEGILE